MMMMMGMCEGDSIEHRCVGMVDHRNRLSSTHSKGCWKFVICRSSWIIRLVLWLLLLLL